MKPFNYSMIAALAFTSTLFISAPVQAQKGDKDICKKAPEVLSELAANKPKLEMSLQKAKADLERHMKIIREIDERVAIGKSWIGRKKTNARQGYLYVRIPCNQRLNIAFRKSRQDHAHLTDQQIFALGNSDFQACAGRRDRNGQRQGGRGYEELPYIIVANSNLLPERHFYDAGDDYNVTPARYVDRGKLPEPWPELEAQRGPYLQAVSERKNQDSLLRRYKDNLNKASVAVEQNQINQNNWTERADACERTGYGK